MQEWTRWMELQFSIRDTDGSQISPNPLMDFMWHQAILNTVLYVEIQTRGGCILHHRAPAKLLSEKRQRLEKLENLSKLYRGRYQDVAIGWDKEHASLERDCESLSFPQTPVVTGSSGSSPSFDEHGDHPSDLRQHDPFGGGILGLGGSYPEQDL